MAKVIACVALLGYFALAVAQRAHQGPTDLPWIPSDNCTKTAAKECSPDAHHLHCHHEDYDHIHLCIGDSIPIPNKCQQMTCLHYDGNVVLLRGCHNVVPRRGCRLTEQDNSRPYPYCCPHEVCGKY